jgi:hypothetical protein
VVDGYLTPEERAAWVRFTREEADLDMQLDRIEAEIRAGEDHALHDGDDDDLYCIEVYGAEEYLREAYESWWAWRAGNAGAWTPALEEVLSDVIFAIGLEFYGSDDDDEEEEE